MVATDVDDNDDNDSHHNLIINSDSSDDSSDEDETLKNLRSVAVSGIDLKTAAAASTHAVTTVATSSRRTYDDNIGETISDADIEFKGRIASILNAHLDTTVIPTLANDIWTCIDAKEHIYDPSIEESFRFFSMSEGPVVLDGGEYSIEAISTRVHEANRKVLQQRLRAAIDDCDGNSILEQCRSIAVHGDSIISNAMKMTAELSTNIAKCCRCTSVCETRIEKPMYRIRCECTLCHKEDFIPFHNKRQRRKYIKRIRKIARTK